VSVSTAQLPVHAPLEVDLSAGSGFPPEPPVGSAVGVVLVAWQPPAPWHRVVALVSSAWEVVLQSPAPQEVDADWVPFLVAVWQPPSTVQEAAAVVSPEPDDVRQPDTPVSPRHTSCVEDRPPPHHAFRAEACVLSGAVSGAEVTQLVNAPLAPQPAEEPDPPLGSPVVGS
jgi:hypothetical protein